MTMLYGGLALVGGTVLLCQTALTLLGFGVDADLDGGDADFDADGPGAGGSDAHGGDSDHGHSSLVGAISFRTLTAAATFFGLTGLLGGELHWPAWQTFALALAAGTAALFAVHAVMRQLAGLGVDGTVTHDALPGHRGTVYVTIPAGRKGVGKVLVEYAARTVELAASTPGEAIPSGTGVVVLSVTGPDTVEVEPVHAVDTT